MTTDIGSERPPFTPGPVTLSGGGVRIEPLGPAHAAGIAAAGADASTFAHLWGEPFAAVADAEAWIAGALAAARAQGDVPFAVFDVRGPSPVLIGSTRFMDVRLVHRGLEIGWTWLAPSACGGGANAAVKLRLLTHCFEDLGAVRVMFKTDDRNRRSQRALAAIGATHEGVLRRHMRRDDGSWRDSVIFSITDVDWPRVRGPLAARAAAFTAGSAGRPG
jgi:RimJ/RimL family protein N-acetyltransferase